MRKIAFRSVLPGIVGIVLGLSSQLRADEPLSVFDIPRLPTIVIDGQAADWADAGFRVDVMTQLGGKRKPSDFDASARLGWTEQGLLLLVTVKSKVITESSDINSLYKGDSVEIFVGSGAVTGSAPAAGASPGTAATRVATVVTIMGE